MAVEVAPNPNINLPPSKDAHLLIDGVSHLSTARAWQSRALTSPYREIA